MSRISEHLSLDKAEDLMAESHFQAPKTPNTTETEQEDTGQGHLPFTPSQQLCLLKHQTVGKQRG